jgi:hypothetical protein
MRGAIRILTAVLLVSLAADSFSAGQRPAASEARELYQVLNTLRTDRAQIYRVRELSLRNDAVRVSMEEGKLAFLEPLQGRVTGAVFTGRGRILAVPRDVVERRSLARFTGAPLLDEGFSRAYFRFTDDTSEQLRRQLRQAGAKPIDEPTFAEEWDLVVADLNPWHSLRVLADWLSEEPQPYFYAGVLGDKTGAFDVLVDERREEQTLIGQGKEEGLARYYNIWASFSRTSGQRAGRGPRIPFSPLRYALDNTIREDRTLEGVAALELRTNRSGERLVPLEMSRQLRVTAVTDAASRPLEFFQNEEVKREEIARRGNDAVFVILPAAAKAGETIRLRLTYRGTVISDAGNGVYFVGERGSWYPHVGASDAFVPFDLRFRWPRRLNLVVTGRRVEEREDGEWRVGRWQSEASIPVAGFNLGEYVRGQVDAGPWRIELHANRQLERAVMEQYSRTTVVLPPPIRTKSGNLPAPRVIWPDAPPSPAALLEKLGADIAESIRFYEKMCGPFPFERLQVAQIPGSFGQGWPGLLYLSTLSFLSPAQQARAGVGQRTVAQFTGLVPAHEVAHQWWGNVVGWSSYRDQWIHEGLANYLALLYVNSKTPGDRELTEWLSHYRDELTQKDPSTGEPADEIGPVTLGYRLRSSKSPGGFTQVIYSKGTWIFHMLRTMLRDPAAKNPDARFHALLQNILRDFRHRGLSTEDFRREIEKVMTPAMALEGGRSMEWFFDQWVGNQGIPRYAVEFTARPPAAAGERFVIRGKLKQRGVPESFVAAVPIYAPRAATTEGRPVLLGTVVTSGAETAFTFTARTAPKKLLIDPYFTLLCVVE